MMFSSATKGDVGRRSQHDAPAREALAHVVVGVALEVQGDAPGQEGAQALAGRAGQGDGDGVVGQALAAVAAGELGAEHGAHRAVDVGDGRADLHPLAALEGGRRLLDEPAVERPIQAVVLAHHLVEVGALGPARAGAGSA